jgi:hypothetical protein
MECLFNGKKVFLTDEAWRAATRMHKSTHMGESFHNFYEDFNDLLAEIPAVLAEGWDLKEAIQFGKPLPLSEEQILDLIWRTTNIYSRFRLWYLDLQRFLSFPTEQSSATNDPLFPTVYVYTTQSAGGLYINYWSCMILLQMILQTCGCMPEDATDSRELANRICKSVEWNANGPWSGFRLGFPLRIAFEAADLEVKQWIGEWHIKLSRTYAATSVQGLPQYPVVESLKQRVIKMP